MKPTASYTFLRHVSRGLNLLVGKIASGSPVVSRMLGSNDRSEIPDAAAWADVHCDLEGDTLA